MRAAMISQVQRSAACVVRIFGRVQPKVCVNSRKVCSRSNRRRNDYQARSMSAAGTATGGPQPHGLGVTVTGQVIDLQPNEDPCDDRQATGVVDPAGTLSQPGVQPVPARRGGPPKTDGVDDRGALPAVWARLQVYRGRTRGRVSAAGRWCRRAVRVVSVAVPLRSGRRTPRTARRSAWRSGPGAAAVRRPIRAPPALDPTPPPAEPSARRPTDTVTPAPLDAVCPDRRPPIADATAYADLRDTPNRPATSGGDTLRASRSAG